MSVTVRRSLSLCESTLLCQGSGLAASLAPHPWHEQAFQLPDRASSSQGCLMSLRLPSLPLQRTRHPSHPRLPENGIALSVVRSTVAFLHSLLQVIPSLSQGEERCSPSEWCCTLPMQQTKKGRLTRTWKCLMQAPYQASATFPLPLRSAWRSARSFRWCLVVRRRTSGETQ